MVSILSAGRLLGGRNGAAAGAVGVLGNEWRGLAIDFVTNTYAIATATGSETLLGSGPASAETALGLDLTDNTYAVRVA